jgi:hypothetical protein
MMSVPGYSRTAFANASGPFSLRMLRQPFVHGWDVSMNLVGSFGSGRSGIGISVERPGSPFSCQAKRQQCWRHEEGIITHLLPSNAASIDDKVSKVSQQLLCTVLTRDKLITSFSPSAKKKHITFLERGESRP